MSKAALQEAFDILPEGLQEYLNTPIPTLEAISSPTDVDSAIIAQGVLAANINAILKMFEGLHVLKIFMHLAQHNEVLQLLGGTAVQYLWAGDLDCDFTILEPVEGVSYAPGENSVSIRITAGEEKVSNVSCTYYIDGSPGGVLEMPQDSEDPTLYIDDITYVAGEYEFTFIVNFDENLRAKQRTITVEEAV